MDLLTNSLQSERYRGCSVTTLGPAELAEIGRVMAHYGLLVARVREFVSYVSTQTHKLPPSVGSKESIKLLPSVLEIIRPAFSPNDVPILRRASDQVYSTSDVHELAMEISLAISYLGKVQGVFQEKLAEESHVLRKKLNRRRKLQNRS